MKRAIRIIVTTLIEVQDPNDVCPNTGPFVGAIAGTVLTEEGKTVDDVRIDVLKNDNAFQARLTNEEGYYIFQNMEENVNYKVVPTRNDHPVNGASTRDIVAIQQHLLGIQTLPSAYKLIAADVNGSNDVTASDITYLRKLILGKVGDFGSLDSWRFVPASFRFENPSNPWEYFGFPEEVELEDMTGQHTDVDFMAIKLGDVTGDVNIGGLNGSEIRTRDKLNLIAPAVTFNAAEVIRVPISADRFDQLTGLQFTLDYDPAKLAFAGVEAGYLAWNDSNINFVEAGTILASWHDVGYKSIDDQQVLFTLVFEARQSGQLQEALRINSSQLKAEAYDAALDVYGLTLRFGQNGSGVSKDFALYQNVPNPFDRATVIGFILPREMEATVTIYDVVGKVLNVRTISGVEGYNEVVVNTDEVNNSGILYYQLSAGDYSMTRKMIVTE